VGKVVFAFRETQIIRFNFFILFLLFGRDWGPEAFYDYLFREDMILKILVIDCPSSLAVLKLCL